MPWSVFFQWSGIAFHSGDPERASAGCVHLPEPDAIAWFNYLRVGNEVQVHGGGDHDGDDHNGDDHNGDDHNGDDHGDSGDDHHGDDHGDHGGDDHGGDDHGGDDSGH
jgi:hypothetical protein